jgi:integrase/recombinase XerC
VRTPRSRTVVAKPDELRRLLALAEPWLRCYLILTNQFGLRHSEACAVCPQSFNDADHTITFMKKGGDPFTLPTTRELEEILKLAPESDDPTVSYIQLLRGNLGLKGPRISKTTVRQNFYKLRDRAGVNPEVRPHDLRRTFAVTAYDQTQNIRLVQQLLGHTSLSTTAKYLENRNLSKLREYLETAPLPTKLTQ